MESPTKMKCYVFKSSFSQIKRTDEAQTRPIKIVKFNMALNWFMCQSFKIVKTFGQNKKKPEQCP